MKPCVFDKDIAISIGLEAAIVLQNFVYWHEQNRINSNFCKNGKVWSYASRANLMKVFPFITERRIRNAIDSLIVNGYLNKDTDTHERNISYYALTDMAISQLVNNCNQLDNMSNSYKDKNKEEEENIREEEFLSLWKELCPRLPSILRLNDRRRQGLKARIREMPEGRKTLMQVLRRLNASTFCTGGNSRKWIADVDWLLLSPNNWVKVLEGRYDDKESVESNADTIYKYYLANGMDEQLARTKAYGNN